MREGVRGPRVSNFRLTTDDSRVGPARADVRDSASSGTRHLAIAALAVFLAVLALGGCGGEGEPQGAGTEPQGPSVSTPSDIVALMNTPRLTSLSSAEGVVTAEGQATTAEGDQLRTYWFAAVGALAYVQEFGGSFIAPKALHGTTLLYEGSYRQLVRGRVVSAERVGTLADPATFLSEDDLNAYALRHADAAGVVVEEVNYVPFFRGTAEFVVRPTDESEFVSEFQSRTDLFVRDLRSEQKPYLVTIVDSSGANRLMFGYFPLSEETRAGTPGPGTGNGIAWAAHDLKICLGFYCQNYELESPPIVGS